MWWSGHGLRRGLPSPGSGQRSSSTPTTRRTAKSGPRPGRRSDVTVERARRDRAPVLLVSPCPPVAMTEGRHLVTTPRSVERRGWPTVEVVDRRADDPRTGLFSERLVRFVRSVLGGDGDRVVCILNRTGRVRLLGLFPVRIAGRLHAVRRCHGPVGGGRWPAVPAVRRVASGVVRGLRLEPPQVAPDRGDPGRRGALGTQPASKLRRSPAAPNLRTAPGPGWWWAPRPRCTGSTGPRRWRSSTSTSI